MHQKGWDGTIALRRKAKALLDALEEWENAQLDDVQPAYFHASRNNVLDACAEMEWGIAKFKDSTAGLTPY